MVVVSPLVAPLSCPLVVLSLLTPNVTRGARDDGGRRPPPTRTSNVVVGVGLAIASLLHSTLPWMLFLALQPYRRSNRCCRRRQCPFRRPPPSPTLVAVTITITLFVAIAIARPPPLTPSPLPLHCPPPSSPSPSPLPPSPLPSSSPASLITINITYVVAIAVAVAVAVALLVAVNRLPPSLPLLLPPKPPLSSLHPTLVALNLRRILLSEGQQMVSGNCSSGLLDVNLGESLGEKC